MKRVTLYGVLTFLFLLVSCSSPRFQNSVTPTASSPLVSSPLDGQWKGTGQTADGRKFTLNLTVQGSELSAILYSFSGSDGLRCTSIEYGQIALDARPMISNNQLTAVLDEDLTLSAVFEEDSKVGVHRR